MRGAATKSMSDIVEERQQSRCPPAAAPLRAAARRPAGFVARSSHTAPGIARRSRLASGPGGLQQNVKLFLREPLAKRPVIAPRLDASAVDRRKRPPRPARWESDLFSNRETEKILSLC